MAKYDFKDKYTRMLKKARTSFTNKQKAGWSRDVSAGFLKEEILEVDMPGKSVEITHGQKEAPHTTKYDNIKEINLRELEEIIVWLNTKVAGEELNRLLKRKVV